MRVWHQVQQVSRRPTQKQEPFLRRWKEKGAILERFVQIILEVEIRKRIQPIGN